MSFYLSLPIDRAAKPIWPGELADLVRQTLTLNASQLGKAMTSGTMKVAVSSEADAIQPDDERSGRVRLVIGGDPRMTETVSFFLNWNEGKLDVEPEGQDAEPATIVGISCTPSVKKLRIIYAEDCLAEQELLARLLTSRGHDVVCCGDGKAALRAIMDQTYDVLVTDNDMPHMTGLDLVLELRKVQHPIRIVVTSGYLESEVEVNYRSLGVERFLPKPSLDEEIFRAVEED